MLLETDQLARPADARQTPVPVADAAPAAAEDADRDELVDSADIPGGGRLYLMRIGEDYEIVFDGEQLMGSWSSRSERALATLACDELVGIADPGVLIGGLGMGFTLGAALTVLPAPARVTVAELVPGVVAWARGPLAHVHGASLDDPRVTLELRDVHDLIAESSEAFDAILLDVDNGPDGLVTLANERLYSPWGLRAASDALRPGGILAVWSAYHDEAFSQRLREAGFDVSEMELDGEPSDRDHMLWLATKRA